MSRLIELNPNLDLTAIALLVGLARIGAILLPLNFRLAAPEWQRLVSDCTPAHLVHDRTRGERITAHL